MPRYFFTTSNGHCIPDEDGSELPDLITARLEAIKLVGELLQNFPDRFWETGVFRLTVADAERVTLFTVEVTAQDPPGTD
jgi:hypothetical protein